MQVSIKFNQAQLSRIKRDFANAPALMRTAGKLAVNRTLNTTRTKVSSEIRRDLPIKKRELESRNLRITLKPTKTHPSGKISVSGGRIPLLAFGAKQGPRSERHPDARPGKRGTSWRTKKGGARQREQSAFIQTMQSGHVGVFQREGGPEVASNIAALQQSQLAPFVEGTLEKNLDHFAKRMLKLK